MENQSLLKLPTEKRLFIETISKLAMEDMAKTKILASLTIAQAILESGWGKSGLTVKANNLFGLKGKYNGAFHPSPTKEWRNNHYVDIIGEFKKYPSWKESVDDHSGLFYRLPQYSNLRGCTDYKLACKYIKDDGYATSPTYTESLINLIELYQLYLYDEEVLKAAQPKKNTVQQTSSYVVQNGDTLWKIAVKQLGNGLRYPEIKKLNNLKSNEIYDGQNLIIPKK